MHITRIKTKDGKEYSGVVLNVEDGLAKEPPYIALRTIDGDINIPLLEMISAVTESERIGVRVGKDGKMYAIIEDIDELPKWLRLYRNRKPLGH